MQLAQFQFQSLEIVGPFGIGFLDTFLPAEEIPIASCLSLIVFVDLT